MTGAELLQQLQFFTGTVQYYRIYAKLLITDGVNFLAQEAGCFWLLDLYYSYLISFSPPKFPFTVLKMKVKQGAADVVIEDGNGTVLATQYVQYTDFPLETIMLYGCWEGDAWIVMLTGEY
jgi:spore maturation protein CgeB